jgi:hypothetical protein
LWKAGKSTMLSHLLKAFERGGHFCGLRVERCGVLVVTEEPQHRWADRRDELNLADNVSLMVRPFKRKPDLARWQTFLQEVELHVKADGFKVVVIDTLSNQWCVRDENNASEVNEALMPVRTLAETGAAVLLMHHPRKSDGTDGTASRGSGALTAFADIIMELRRFTPGDQRDRRRTIKALGRDKATLAELVVELKADGSGYTVHGDRYDAATKERNDLITLTLPNRPPGMTCAEVHEAWPEEGGKKKPSRRTVEVVLKDGAEDGLWTASGQGTKDDPRRFWVKDGGSAT